jgi:hypothetical protein
MHVLRVFAAIETKGGDRPLGREMEHLRPVVFQFSDDLLRACPQYELQSCIDAVARQMLLGPLTGWLDQWECEAIS